MGSRSGKTYTQEQIDDCLTAVIAYAGNAAAAHRHLEAEKKRTPGAQTLKAWALTTHWGRYEELRETFKQQREEKLARDFLDVSDQALRHLQTALEKTGERLEKGEDQDPARTAANLSKVGAVGIEKSLTLQGRPTSIKETRTPEQVLTGLVTKYPQLFGQPPALEAGDDPG